MTPNERLQALCGEQPRIDRVLQLTADGRRWLFATNGWAFLALLAGPLDDEPEADPGIVTNARKMMESALTSRKAMPWAALREFMRVDGPMEVPCRVCGGTEEVECHSCGHTTECESCDGGMVERKAEPVRLFAAHVNRVLFHQFADGLDARTVTYAYGGELDAVVFADADPERTWVLGIMPMKLASAEQADTPAFQVPS